MRSLTDHAAPAADAIGRVLGPELARAAGALDRLEDEGAAAALVEGLLRHHRPPPDASAALVNRVVERITADGAVRAVGDLVRPFGLSPRTLQGLFREYVGVGPKWVIRRCRLHDALERALEDIASPIADAGGSAHLYGVSSGGALALEATGYAVRVTPPRARARGGSLIGS